MAYLLRNICTKNYWNRTTIVEIIDGRWVVFFFDTQCTLAEKMGGCGDLGPRLIQCGMGRGLLPYQAASSSIQPFGHSELSEVK